MKKITFILTLALLAANTYGQDSSSSTSSSSGTNRDTSSTNSGNTWNKNSRSNRWSDTAYYRRNRLTYDSLLRINRGRWNEDSSYYITAIGDTLRQYRRSDWMRDSMNFENRNWDSSWQGRELWGNDMNQSGQYNSGTDQTSGSRKMSSDSGSMNSNTMNADSSTMNSGTSESKADSAGRNRSGRTTDRKTTGTQSSTSDKNAPALSGAGDTQSSSGTAKSKDRVYMKNNVLMVSKNGVSSKVAKSITLKDGTVVSANGTVKMPDGTTMKLKNGESISLGQKSSKSSSTKKENQ